MNGMLSGLSGRSQCQLGFPRHRAHSGSQQMMPKLFLFGPQGQRSHKLHGFTDLPVPKTPYKQNRILSLCVQMIRTQLEREAN